MCLQYILARLTLSIFLLPPPSLPSTISTDFILLFSYMNTKCIHHIHPHSPFPYVLSPPWYPPPEKTCFPVHLFLKCILKIKGVLPWHFRLLYIVLNNNNPYYLLFLYYHVPLLLNSVQCIMLYYIHM
jgi:hypothetical protein